MSASGFQDPRRTDPFGLLVLGRCRGWTMQHIIAEFFVFFWGGGNFVTRTYLFIKQRLTRRV